MTEYSTIPAGATLDVEPFKCHVPEEELQHFRQLLELSPIGPATFVNSAGHEKFGIQRNWLESAKETWLNDFDWRKCEDRINSFPNFKATVKDERSNEIEMQFLALFSERKDAVPIVMLHGYPTSILDFLDLLDLVREKYSPADLPYHIIVPSLPGYGYSSGPPLHTDYNVEMAASAINSLMSGLGFASYLTQGGDLGSFISRTLALKYDTCKGMHVNMMGLPGDIDPAQLDPSSPEMKCLLKAGQTIDTEFWYGIMQGQKPATIGLALASSPLALLSYLAPILRSFTDDALPLQKVLESVTLYWLSETFPRCIWHSRSLIPSPDQSDPKVLSLRSLMNPSPEALRLPYVDKPTGYSLFPKEVVPVPRGWAEKSCNLVSFREHEKGGHLAALEVPEAVLGDVEEFVKVAWR